MKQPAPIHLYNTLSRRVELLKPIKKGTVGLYTCGPTVYNYAHIGNLRTFTFEDILERVLTWDGYTVDRVMNVTDVGHLTGDTDEGVDKVEKEAVAEKKTVQQIVKFYTAAFLRDIKKMNIAVPQTLAPATKFVPEQIALIKQLFKKGLAYETARAVYFDTARLKDYGKLAGQTLADKNVGARADVVTDSDKRNPADFALWFKTVDRFEHHIMRWPSPWGVGFPGWHIECSAISRKFLGQPFDIHTGGIDHIGTHHTNEIAQSEGAYGKPLARTWMHGEFLVIDKEKMAKSAGNFMTLQTLEDHDVSPLVFRYFLLTAHYRTPLNFSWMALQNARNSFNAFIGRALYLAFLAEREPSKALAKDGQLLKDYQKRFTDAINNDLNVPQALAAANELLHDKQVLQADPKGVRALILDFDRILGLRLREHLKKFSQKALLTDKKLRDFAVKRQKLRDNQQFMQSDRLRRQINALGYVLEDTPFGPFLAPAKPEL